MQDFGHVVAGIWMEPSPISPISAVTKVSQTQAALLSHLETTAQDGFARLQVLQETNNDLLKPR